MKRVLVMALMAAMLCGFAAVASAETEVKMAGDVRMHVNFIANPNFTPWNARGMSYFTGTPQAAIAGVAPATGTMEKCTLWERFRLRTDFISNENLSFRFGIRVNNQAWGNQFAIDSPPVSIDVYQAYLRFKIPTTEAEVMAGYMPLALPQSKIFNGGLILDTELGNTGAAAITVNVPIVKDTFAIKLGYSRFLDASADTYSGLPNPTTPNPNALDGFFMTLPINYSGFEVIPWGMFVLAGRNTNWNGLLGGTVMGPYAPWGEVGNSVLMNMTSAAAAMRYVRTGQNTMWSNDSNNYYWLGVPFNITAADPVNFYADVIYGSGANGDFSSSQRSGWFLDVGVEYAGLSFMKPQLVGWWSSGENSSFSDGSERIPFVKTFWNFAGSFLYHGAGTVYTRNTLLVNPTGSWGLGFALQDVKFGIKDLSHRLTFTLANGTNSPAWARTVAASGFNGMYATMGKDLTTEEWIFGINLDSKYMLYDNLALITELGYASVSGLRGSVWGARNVNNYGDAWKIIIGLRYTF